MMPALQVGDRLVVSKYPYGWSWTSISFHLAPRGSWRIWPATPQYGDIVIPVHPVRDEDYIKRVVALPGDTIEGSEEHTSELQSLMRISYAVFCLKKKNKQTSMRI